MNVWPKWNWNKVNFNKSIEHIKHGQKVRKYLVAYYNSEYQALKFGIPMLQINRTNQKALSIK